MSSKCKYKIKQAKRISTVGQYDDQCKIVMEHIPKSVIYKLDAGELAELMDQIAYAQTIRDQIRGNPNLVRAAFASLAA